MPKFFLVATLLVGIFFVVGAAQADTMLEDEREASFGACIIIQGTALAGLRSQGAVVTVVVNDQGRGMYLAKAEMGGKVAMLSCEGGHRKVWMVE